MTFLGLMPKGSITRKSSGGSFSPTQTGKVQGVETVVHFLSLQLGVQPVLEGHTLSTVMGQDIGSTKTKETQD